MITNIEPFLSWTTHDSGGVDRTGLVSLNKKQKFL